ncbi:MAG: glycosyltransferase family 2 protein [Anaerolineales bacterium]
MTEPRVSAIITAYNSEAFVDDAITSVLRQSRPVDEILVVDDGSTDRTREIVETYKDRGVIYLFQENAGAGAARNLGIQHSQGEFVAFLDADDIWLEDKNRLQVDYLIAHPEVALVSGLSLWWNVAKDSRQQHGKAPTNMKTLRREILVRNVIGNPSMCMARRSAILEVGLFDRNTRLCLDFDLWTRIAARFEMAILSSPVIVYRWHQGNLSVKYRWDRFFRTWEISRRAITRSRPAWQRPWLLARAWSAFTHRKAVYAIEHGFPRWQQIAYEVGASLAYPLDDTSEKLRTMVRALMGDATYQSMKHFIRSRLQA